MVNQVFHVGIWKIYIKTVITINYTYLELANKQVMKQNDI